MTGLANILGQGLMMNWYYWKRVGLDIPRFWKNILSIEWIPVLMCVVTVFVSNYIDFSRIPVFFAGVIVYSIIYCLLLWKFSLRDDDRQLVLKPLYRLRKKLAK